MSETLKSPRSRRGVLKLAAALPAALAAVPFVLAGRGAEAAKMPKKQAQYQPDPNGNQKCANCRFYVEGEGGGPGKCQVVAGEIAPEAWCALYAPQG